MGFCFCDGFNLHTLRKLVWFAVFLAISIYTLITKNEFNLAFILPIPTLLAILLCAYEKKLKHKTQ
jgi:asparagine N-glycosylation enzyme membrane subunit Stt3